MLGVLLCIAAGTWLFLLSLRPPPRLLGVYSRPGFWYPLKLVLFYLLLRLRQWREDAAGCEDQSASSESGSNSGSSSKVDSGAGVGSAPGQKVKKRPTPEMMERVQPLSDHPKAIDAVYFNSGNPSGHYLVAATARRPKGVINGLLYLRIPGVGLLQLPKMPDTFLFGDGEHFGAEGLRITPIEPMTSWRIQFDGPMKLRGSPLSQHQVELDVTFTSDQPYFHFDTDMDLWTLARCVAREPWSPHFFDTLQQAHQSHYEQMGRLEGTAVVDGLAHVLRLHSMRDHSYGYRREWKLMHRYGLHMFTTEDGLQGNVGVICQPTVLSQLEMGYVCRGGQIESVTKVDLLLWQHGENGHPPTDYAFSFTAGGTEYLVEVTVLEAPEFYIGWEWETRVVECMVSFRVNGRKGWGVAEWDYRHHGGRPHIYASHDPAWTADLVKDCDDETGDISEDGLRCVVHYPELHLSKRTKVILLSERSYSKLLQSKKLRGERKGEERHFPQCEGVPVPTYDPHVEGYHRPCYMKFVRVARKESKSEQPQENQIVKDECEPPQENNLVQDESKSELPQENHCNGFVMHDSNESTTQL